MFLDFIGKVFIFIVKSHIAVIKTGFQSFDFRFIFINFQARKLPLL